MKIYKYSDLEFYHNQTQIIIIKYNEYNRGNKMLCNNVWDLGQTNQQ